jgi:hypothetical protein
MPREPWPGLVCQLVHERCDARGAVAALASVVAADALERRHFMALTGLPLTAVREDLRLVVAMLGNAAYAGPDDDDRFGMTATATEQYVW